MFSPIFPNKNQQNKFIPEQQFEEIVDAILAGKYSWACFLMLQAKGYNPFDYMPYRTYNRLIKNNCLKKGKGSPQNKAGQDITHSKNLKKTGIYP